MKRVYRTHGTDKSLKKIIAFIYSMVCTNTHNHVSDFIGHCNGLTLSTVPTLNINLRAINRNLLPEEVSVVNLGVFHNLKALLCFSNLTGLKLRT